MKQSREFEIAFVGLKLGEHTYHYSITDQFFEPFGKQEFNNAQIEVKMVLDKKLGTMYLKFDINGTVNIPCDRCSDEFELKLWDEFDLLVKIVDDELVEKLNIDDVEVFYIGRSESILNVSDFIFEFIMLCFPIQRVHGTDAEGNSLCNPDVLKLLNNQNNHSTNPIWDTLKNKLNKN